MEKYLRKLYRKFLKFQKRSLLSDFKKHSTSLQGIKLSNKTLKEFYENYYKVPYLTFLYDVKSIIYSENVFDHIKKNFSDDWELWRYLKFLKDEKVIKVQRNGKVNLLRKEITKIIPKPQTKEEIRKKVEKKLRIKVKKEVAVINLFKKFKEFSVKAKWDQLPISVGSAFFITEKILERLPKKKRFLFVGDDDFVSVILSLVDSNIESLVIDADQELLECIDILSKKFRLKIETKKVDIRNKKNLGEKFVGFLVNPIYTEAGVKEFIRFGISQLGQDGGVVFLEVGDEAIGNRFLFLQDFFAKNNLILRELINNKIFYPHIMLYKEDKEILNRLSLMIDKKVIKKSPKLGALLYIFDYLPQKAKRVKFKKPIYAYL